MRFTILVTALVVTAGCLGIPGTSEMPTVEAAAFEDADAPWVASYSSGCGMCPGMEGYHAPTDHFVVFVFENERALLVRFNGGWNDGDAFHVSPNVTYDPDALEDLLAVVPRAGGGDVWVVTAETGRIAEDGFAAGLVDRWAPSSRDPVCTDYGAHYSVNPPDAAPTTERVICPVEEGDDLHPFASRMHAVYEGLKALEDA